MLTRIELLSDALGARKENDESYGRFAQICDPDGDKIEPWE